VTRYLIDGRPLQGGSAMRGIGTYVRGLLGGLASVGASGDVALLLERGAPPPAMSGLAIHPARLLAVNRHLRPLLDPFQVRAALSVRRPGLYHAVEYAQPVLPPVPVVVTVHDLIPFVMPADYPWMRRERTVAMHQLKHADALIAVSQATADDLRRIAGADPRRVTVIPEGVPAPVALPPERLAALRAELGLPDRFLLAVGTFDPRKRIDLTVEVVRRVRKAHDVGLVIAGFQGNFSAAVERAVARGGIAGDTRILGHVSTEQLAALYQLGECLVFTSAYEGFGLPPLEAMAAGLPVVVFDNSSLAEVVGANGLLIRDGDIAAMAEAVSAILADPRERSRRAESGRERAAEFTWERAARATLAVYSTLLDGAELP
jgi:glycosyltransferase involved in cell wall biosynthesis